MTTAFSPALARPSRGMLWTGRILSGLVIVFLLLDAGIKLVPIAPVTQTLQELGFRTTDTLARGLGVLLLVCTGLHALPRTSVIGAVLLTGYLGGAMAIHLRHDSPLFSHLLFGAYLGVALWVGLLLRRPRLRSILVDGAT